MPHEIGYYLTGFYTKVNCFTSTGFGKRICRNERLGNGASYRRAGLSHDRIAVAVTKTEGVFQ